MVMMPQSARASGTNFYFFYCLVHAPIGYKALIAKSEKLLSYEKIDMDTFKLKTLNYACEDEGIVIEMDSVL